VSGLVAGFNEPVPELVQQMFAKINHRGPAISGIWQNGQVVLAQNYGVADTQPEAQDAAVPVGGTEGGPRICYDGQLGNWRDLAGDIGFGDGAFREERLLLELHRRHGPDMLRLLGDAIFALVISDGNNLLAARDLLGIKTLFYGRRNGTLYFASELKSLCGIADDVREFPAGHFMDAAGTLNRFAELPQAPEPLQADIEEITETIRQVIWRSVVNRVDFSVPTAGLLSGGMDSSVICALATRLLRQEHGPEARLKTFALGVGESDDIRNARIVAEHIGADHHELLVDLDEVVAALPEVIYYLENFDASLVRSAVSNYLISQRAREHGIEQLLSGEGGDEVFCGYAYLKQFPADELLARQRECLGYLHSNASLRLDRMNQCHSIRVVAPLISGELLDYALRIPPEYKQKPDGDGKIEKWIFRKAYEWMLPEAVVWRAKQEFSQGSGSADVLPRYFESVVGDEEYAEARQKHPCVRSKEELYYFRIFADRFGTGSAVDTAGQWVCL